MSLIRMETMLTSIPTTTAIIPTHMQNILYVQAPFVVAVRIRRRMLLNPEELFLQLSFFIN